METHKLSNGFISEEIVRAYATYLIVRGDAEKALSMLSIYYRIITPRIRIGLPKKHSKALGCYDPVKKTICLRSSEEYRNPFVILHEYYHHLRNSRREYLGNEKYADRYALKSIMYFKELLRTSIRLDKVFNSL
ncbi:hypothetical protein Smar_0669 [Staphylothermus marinus F1]|uniref:Uncharacterized protein n=2 Tax=Staphylothermus marinus TaxID=2280 RepID=A3DMB5_STAMF|nr:hypothetical protein Smar_0669 [Staphylothermus marinus F1]